MLAAAAGSLERLRGEDQEAAGKERDHCEHIEIHAVRARGIAASLLERLHRCSVDAWRQQRLHAADECGAVGALRKAHVEAIELAQPLEAPLRAGDVDERRLAAQRGARQHAGDGVLHAALADHEPQPVAFAQAERGSRAR